MREYEQTLRNLGGQYFIKDLQAVPDLMSWAKENNQDLSEPYNPMKLVGNTDDSLSMVVQKEIKDEMLNSVITNLGIRWSLRDNVTDMDSKLNSVKKKLVFCFLKERAKAMKDVGGDEQIEDQWAIDEMGYLGFFNE
jgi:hypothetical protein